MVVGAGMKVEVSCFYCDRTYLDLIDTVEINGVPVQFLACFSCERGYTKCEEEVELI